ncbi:hypothetical protein THAOC_13669 [Thalassiosira oceanica]|uniref:B30.2/SPRY domain-containing protein n=1 Tax=Thalassiosira oceanica TaxID=159749 RepID=K0SGZ6_THAOC|nr:hypothetical protein THAOC_13669 [Thalassiosira oceanica]|eukprot:EJK65463.1 hypothetical protein THAOC_13669 [Thalassiosira oceanica]
MMPMMQPRDNKRARLLPTAALDVLGNDLLVRCASYLDADGLAQLGRTSARFGIPQAGQQRSLANETARQRFLLSATDEERSRLPEYDDESDVGLLRALEQLRKPLCFYELVGNSFSPQEHQASVTHTGRNYWYSTALSGHVMRGGRHFIEFTINDQQSSYFHLGIMRPVSLTDGIDLEAEWNGSVNPAIVSSHWKPAVAEKLRSQRTAQWGESNVHCCAYDCGDGQCNFTDWDNEDDYEEWQGQEALRGNGTIGLLLDLDEGTLSVFKDGRRLGSMKEGLGGEYCWFVAVGTPCTISISRAPSLAPYASLIPSSFPVLMNPVSPHPHSISLDQLLQEFKPPIKVLLPKITAPNYRPVPRTKVAPVIGGRKASPREDLAFPLARGAPVLVLRRFRLRLLCHRPLPALSWGISCRGGMASAEGGMTRLDLPPSHRFASPPSLPQAIFALSALVASLVAVVSRHRSVDCRVTRGRTTVLGRGSPRRSKSDPEHCPATTSPRSFRPRRPFRATARLRRVMGKNRQNPTLQLRPGSRDGETKAAAGERRQQSACPFGLAPFAVPCCSRQSLSRPPKFSVLLPGDSVRSRERAAEPSVRLAPGGRCVHVRASHAWHDEPRHSPGGEWRGSVVLTRHFRGAPAVLISSPPGVVVVRRTSAAAPAQDAPQDAVPGLPSGGIGRCAARPWPQTCRRLCRVAAGPGLDGGKTLPSGIRGRGEGWSSSSGHASGGGFVDSSPQGLDLGRRRHAVLHAGREDEVEDEPPASLRRRRGEAPELLPENGGQNNFIEKVSKVRSPETDNWLPETTKTRLEILSDALAPACAARTSIQFVLIQE